MTIRYRNLGPTRKPEYRRHMCVRARVSECAASSPHSACWSCANRAVSHLLRPGWELSGDPGNLCVQPSPKPNIITKLSHTCDS